MNDLIAIFYKSNDKIQMLVKIIKKNLMISIVIKFESIFKFEKTMLNLKVVFSL